MRLFVAPCCIAAFLTSAISTSAENLGQPRSSPMTFITRVEVDPVWEQNAVAALLGYREASLKDAGAVRVHIYQELSRKNRFLIDEVWKDVATYEAHARSSKLADGLKAGLLAPPDGRPYSDWSVSPHKTPEPSAVYVFTHIDVHPPQLADLEAILRPYAEKSRSDKGVQRFDVLQGSLTLAEQEMGKIANRKNHLTLAEIWTSEADFKAHQESAHAIAFRTKLGPLLGALYDQRLYKLVR